MAANKNMQDLFHIKEGNGRKVVNFAKKIE